MKIGDKVFIPLYRGIGKIIDCMSDQSRVRYGSVTFWINNDLLIRVVEIK